MNNFNPNDWEDITNNNSQLEINKPNTFNPSEWEDITESKKKTITSFGKESFQAPLAPDIAKGENYTPPSLMDSSKKFINDGIKEVGDFAKIGLGVTESPFQKNTNEPNFDTLASVKSLTNTSNPTDWRKNVEKVLMDRGYSDIRFSQDNKIYANTKDGKNQEISGGFIKDSLASLVGDKFKETGAIVGATKGYNYASKLPIPNPYLKGGAVILGTTLGAGVGAFGGDTIDQTESKIKNDEIVPTVDRVNSSINSANDGMISELIGLGVGKSVTALPDMKNAITGKIKDSIAKKVYGEIASYQNPNELMNILELAKKAGIKLTPAQLTDNKAIEQLNSVIAQNPVLSQKINVLNKNNKVAMNKTISELLDSIGIDSKKLTNANNIDPLAKDIKDGLAEVKSIRGNQIKNAYDLFESSVTGKAKLGLDGINNKILELRDEALTMPNPDSFNKVLDLVSSRVDSIQQKKGYLDAVDLNNISKQLNQIYKRNFEDSSSRAAVMMFKSYLDKDLERLSKREGDSVYNALQSAKNMHIEKENIYGKTSQLPFRKTLDNNALETIVNDIMNSNQGVTNAKALKEELKYLPNGDKILGSLARRFIDESLHKSKLSNSVFTTKEINSRDLLKAFDGIDYRQLEILTNKETVDKLHSIRKLTELIMKQDKVLGGNGGGLNTMGIVRSNVVDKIMDFMRIRAFGKIITTPVTQDLLYRALKNTSNSNLNEANINLKEIDKLIKGK